jgi:hypothetical protein
MVKNKINNTEDELYKKMSINKHIKNNLDKYLNSDNKWNELFELLVEYCNENERTPTNKTEYKTILIGLWLQHQKEKINDINNELYIKMSTNRHIKKSLDEYLYPENKWNAWFELLVEYCNENKCAPTYDTKYKDKTIGSWLQRQKTKINDTNDVLLYKKLSTNEYIKKSLDEKKSNKLNWDEWFKLLTEYCNENKCIPSKKTEYKNRLIGKWLYRQKNKINNSEDELYKKLSGNEYIKKNLDNYLELDNKWNKLFKLLEEYCNKNKCMPTWQTKYKNESIGVWLQRQKNKINSCEDEIYKKMSINKIIKQSIDDYLKKKLHRNNAKNSIRLE